jgi:hypothetical protein
MMAQDVRTVTAPDGRRFTIFLGAPGSFLDAGSRPQRWVGALDGLVVLVHAMVRASGKEWRLDVEPLSPDWHLGRALHRERVGGQSAAEERSADLATLIESGQWDPASRLSPPSDDRHNQGEPT